MAILDDLRDRGVWYELLLHRPASCSTRRAGLMKLPGRIVAKAVLVQARDSALVAVLPATRSIDLDRLSAVLGLERSEVRLATEDEAARVFRDCEAGVVPAFGRLYGLKTIVDDEFARLPIVVFGANSRHEAVRMRFADFASLERPFLASFTCPIDIRTPVARRSRGGRRAG